MTSQINPNNIDGAYPVAGQDNNSQGFRDNFTNTKVNFQYAEDEINDLQAKVLLKSALTGSYLDNNMNDNLIYAAKIQDFSATKVTVTTTSGSVAINYAAGHYQTIATSGNISLSFLNFPSTGTYGWIRLQINVTSTAHTVTLPGSVTLGVDQLQGFDSVTRAISFIKTGFYEFEFTTSNSGSTITVFDLSRNYDPMFLPGSQDVASAAAISLTKTVSYFTTSGNETSTLANGTEGQLKTLVGVNLAAGSMTVTVASPGWGGAGTITFMTSGSSCILQYTQGAWYVLGTTGSVYFNSYSQELNINGAVDLTVPVTYFTPAGALTATMGAGQTARKKILILASAGTVTINNVAAGWLSSGTGSITLSIRGDSCTVEWVDSKWYCTGNNGATFA